MKPSPESSNASEYSASNFVTATAQDSDEVVAAKLEQTTLNDIAAGMLINRRRPIVQS